MRYVPSIPPATTSPDTRRVRGVYAVHAVKPVHRHEPGEPYAGPQPSTRQALPVAPSVQGHAPVEERRKASRRVSHQPVLVELRSGIDRRRNWHEGDEVVHIDETA